MGSSGSAATPPVAKKEDKNIDRGMSSVNRGMYSVNRGTVRWNQDTVRDVHHEFFTPLDCGYARDEWRVFYKGQPLKEVKNVKDFKVYGNGAATDGKHQYLYGELVNAGRVASFHEQHYKPGSFHAPSNLYNVKNNRVRWRNKPLNFDTHPEFFNPIGGGYGKDYWTVFWHEKRIPGVNASSFAYDPASGMGSDGVSSFLNGEMVSKS